MKKLLLALAASVAAYAAPASAATFMSFDGSIGVYGNDQVATPNFSDTFIFDITSPSLVSGTISSIFLTPASNIDFTSVTLNGIPFSISSTGAYEARFINGLDAAPGPLVLTVEGTSGSNAAYSGVLNVSVSPVPEPAIWMMMIAGFGLVGTAMRKRDIRRVSA